MRRKQKGKETNNEVVKVTPYHIYLPGTQMTSIFEGQPPKNKALSIQNNGHLGSRYMIHVFGEEVPLTLTTTKDNDSEKWYSNFLVDQQRSRALSKNMPRYSFKFEILKHFISVLNSLILATRHVGGFQIMNMIGNHHVHP